MTKITKFQDQNINVLLEHCEKFGLKTDTIQKIKQDHQNETQLISKNKKFADLKAVEPVSLTRYRNARFIMANPLFSCDQRKRLEPIEYKFLDNEGQERFIQVTANATYGMATQRDADVIRFAISKIGEIGQQTGYYPDTIEETPYRILKALKRNTCKRGYDWLKEAIERLSGHIIKTNVFTINSKSVFMDSIAGFEWLEDENNNIKKLKIRLPKQLIEAIRERYILALDPLVIAETGSLKKRLLELVQVHMGTKNEWEIGIEKFKNILPYKDALRRLKQDLKRSNLPYKITFRVNGSKEQIIHFQRLPSSSN